MSSSSNQKSLTADSRQRKKSIHHFHLRFTTLRTRLILAFVGVTLLSVSSVAVVSYQLIRTNLTQQVGANLNQVATTNAQVIGEFVTRNLRVLETLALNPEVQAELDTASAANPGKQALIDARDQEWQIANATGDDNDPLVAGVLNHPLSTELRLFRDKFPENVEVFVTDKYGVIIASTNRTSDYYQADEGWWQGAYHENQGGIYVGQPEFDDSSKTYAVNIAVPVLSRTTPQIVGILRTTVTTQALDALLNSASFGQTGRVDMRLPGGQIITGDKAGFTPLDPTEVSHLDALAGSFGEFIYRGSSKMVSQMPVSSLDPQKGNEIAQLGWSAVAYQERSEALGPINAVVQVALVTILAALVLVSLFGIFLAQQLSRPIVRLTEVVGQVASGDLAARAAEESIDETGLLARAFNAMTNQLRQTLEDLEKRVTERTRALETSAEVSRRLSTILDQGQLVKEVVEQLQKAFDYYHVHIYLYDEARENLVMAGGTGEAGRVLLEHGHKLPRGKGLVGRAAETKVAVLAPNVLFEPTWLPNPLLPDTRSELALPIASGESILGVLDVQQNRVEGLNQEDVILLQSIAAQVAVALQNARAYTRARDEAKREALLAMISDQIRGTTSVNEALQVAVRELGRVIGANTGVQLKMHGNGKGDGQK